MSKSKKEVKDTFITYWEEEISRGEKYMKKYSTVDKWQTWRQHYRGDWAASIVPVNRTFSWGRTMIPRVYFRSPKISITATRPEYIRHAMVVEAIDNWLIHETNLKKTLKTAIMHSYHCGTAPIKLGFDSEYGYLPSQAISDDSSTATQLSTKDGKKIEYNVNIKPGLPWALPCMPEDVIIPWGHKDPDELPWIGHKIIRPLEAVMQDQKYQNKSELKGTRRAATESRLKSPFSTSDEDIKYAELIEIRDFRSGEIIVISEGKLLLKSDDILQQAGLPYEFLTFNEDPEYFWGIPDCYILEPQQNELNEVKTQQSRHRKIALLKFLYQKNAVAEEEIEKFLSGDVGVAVGINVEAIQTAIIALQPHMPQELWKEAQMILNDMRESLGYSENQSGGYNPKGGNVSATETSEVAQSVDLRENERKDIVADLMVNIIKKWNAMIFNLWDQNRIVEIIGPEGDSEWVEFSGDQIYCEYKIKIDPDTGFPMTGNAKRQFADGLLKTYNGDPLVDQMKLRRFHLSAYENLSPGALSILQNPQVLQPGTSEEANALLSAARQPSPDGSGSQMGSPAGSNRGGGRRPINFESWGKEKS